VIVRLFAILLALGMLVISTQTPDLATSSMSDTPAMVDAADELPPAEAVESPAIVSDPRPAQIALPVPRASAGRRPDLMIFRPPRAAAFV
jgi:hypothetical protein